MVIRGKKTILGSEQPTPPFSLEALVSFLRRIPYPLSERVTSPGEVERLVESSDGSLKTVRLSRDDDSREILLSSSSPLTDLDVISVHNIFEWNCRVRPRLAENLSIVHALGPALALPVLRWESSFSSLITTIIEQQKSWLSATRDISYLLEKSARRQGNLALFPTAQEFFERPELLEGIQVTYGRKRLILDLAQRFLNEPDFVDGLCIDLPQAESNLLAIPGVGPWTAQVYLSKRFGYRPSVPLHDVALQRASAHFFLNEKRKLTPSELAAVFEPFQDLAGEVSHRLLMRWVMETY